MVCKSCGKRLQENEKFCTVCGYFNTDTEEEEESSLFEEIDESDSEEEVDDLSSFNEDNDDLASLNEENDDLPSLEETKLEKEAELKGFDIVPEEQEQFDNELEQYIESYIGEDYKIIKKSPINVYALILNWMYVLYRKCYITGIIGLVIIYILTLFFPDYLLFFIGISMIMIGLLFNKYYLFIIKGRVKRLLNKYEGSDEFNLKEICKQNGGVNVLKALIIYFVFLLLLLIPYVVNRQKPVEKSKYWEETSENQANCMSFTKQSYKDFDKTNTSGIVTEATCKVVVGNPKQFRIYLKVSSNKKIYYTFYLADGKKLSYQSDTKEKETLEEKKTAGNITSAEQTKLYKIQEVVKEYDDILSKSKKENELINKQEEKEAKKNFVFGKEEIMR